MQSVITHYNTFIHTGCKVPWALRGGGGAAPLSADNTPPRNPFIMVPVTLRNRSVTVRVDGDGISHIGAYTLKHRHFRHASSRFRKDQLQVDLSSGVSTAVMVANIVFFPQPLGIDIQLHRQLVRLHINPQECNQLRSGSTP